MAAGEHQVSKLATRNVAASAYERIKADVLQFEFLPGERLVELDLVDRYGVSRTPIREALRRLAHEGLLTRHERGGHFVRRYDISAYEDVYAVRTVLECWAARLACETRTDEDIVELTTAWREGYVPDEVPLDGSYTAPDERFHLAIARATGNSYLVTSLEAIHDQLHIIRSIDFADRERIIVSEQQHLDVAQAIVDRDADAAADRMEQHIAQSKREIRQRSLQLLERLGSRELRRAASER
jgi:DNA-binding GntR family transcriptional regulator